MTGPPRFVIVQNSEGSGPGRLPGWLAEEGFDAEVIAGADLVDASAAGTHVGASHTRMAGLVLLGGGMMPDDDERFPHLPRERELVGEAINDGVPVLGICLGAQLLALVAGGEVTANSGETERGSCSIRLLDAARDDPLFATLTGYPELRMIQNHRDSITVLPPGAVHLGTSPACAVQAFRVGAVAWGVQFHPEAAASRVADWDESALAADGFDRGALIAEANADADINTRQARELVGAFAEIVRNGRG
jgi:GMP synthase-like glutamine amidotransferase